jgi:hypothetical protein
MSILRLSDVLIAIAFTIFAVAAISLLHAIGFLIALVPVVALAVWALR